MLNIIADTHTHSMACDHAYSTISENIEAARERGLHFLASTEHTTTLPGAPSYLYFQNLLILPDVIDDIVVLKGAEVNIIDYDGSVDLSDTILSRLDWVIASFHLPCVAPGTVEEHTKAWLKVVANPLIDVLGHMGDCRYSFDQETVVKACSENQKIVEINAHSFVVRPGSKENCPEIAKLCIKYGVPVVISSDSHYKGDIGNFTSALEMLESIHFPEELVLNADYDRFLALAREKSGRKLI